MTEEASLDVAERQHVTVDGLLQLTDVPIPVCAVQLL